MRKREVFNFRITAYIFSIYRGCNLKKTELSVYYGSPSRNVTQVRGGEKSGVCSMNFSTHALAFIHMYMLFIRQYKVEIKIATTRQMLLDI